MTATQRTAPAPRTARDDYPILVAYVNGFPMLGMNADVMTEAVTEALDEIDRLRESINCTIAVGQSRDDFDRFQARNQRREIR